MAFFISLESSWNVNVWNGLALSFGYLKHKLWPKEGPGVKLPVWLPTRKSWESSLFTWLQSSCNSWKAFDESYNFALNRISIRGLFVKLWGSKVAGILIGAISKLSLRSPGREKSVATLDVGFVANHRVYYKGEGGGFLQVHAVVSLVCPCCPWLILAPKVF